MRLGVLALQGAFREHVQKLESLGCQSVLVRQPSGLTGLSGLIIPGGESTVMSRLAQKYGLFDPIRQLVRGGLPVYGTCAGMILLANRVLGAGPDQEFIGGLGVSVLRNAFGSQTESFEVLIEASCIARSRELIRAVFIRAPRVVSLDSDVEVLARLGEEAVMVRQGSILASSFHPELTGDSRLHEFFLDMVKNASIVVE